jgi:hypothetical protein
MLTSISGLIPPPSTSPSSTCHPEGISTETIAGLSSEFPTIANETSLWIISSKGGLGVPVKISTENDKSKNNEKIQLMHVRIQFHTLLRSVYDSTQKIALTAFF